MVNETSKYIQINNWCLIEYIYNTGVKKTQSKLPSYIVENTLTDEYGFLAMGDAKEYSTLQNSAIAVNKNKSLWAWTGDYKTGDDSESDVKNIWNYPSDANDELRYISGSLTKKQAPIEMKDIVYDRVRLHILAGYYLDGIDGIVFEPIFKEKTTRNMPASSYFYSKSLGSGFGTQEGSQIGNMVFAKTPLLLSEKSYDKYIEFYVPSFYDVQKDWEEKEEDKSKDFAYNYSHSKSVSTPPAGYVKDSPIYINFYELTDSFTRNGCKFFYVKNKYTTSIKSNDAFANLGCHIEEDSDGDYFKYYPTFEGGFIDSYMQMLNSNNGSNGESWSIYNTLEVNELVGIDSIRTYSATMVMNSSDYDRPIYFRPLLEYADRSVSAIVKYTMKLLNNSTGETIVRIASAGIPIGHAQKYGKKLTSLKVNLDRPIKVYNKNVTLKAISSASSIDMNRSIGVSSGKESIAYRDLYIDSHNICMNTNDTEVLTPENGTMCYGQSQLTIFISKFDNVFKFKEYNLENYEFMKSKIPADKLQNMSMQFIMDNGSIKSFPVIRNDESGENEFEVLIDKVSAAIILKQTKDKNFYIVLKSGNGSTETLIYTGMWRDIAERSSDLYNTNKSLIEWINAKLREIQEREASLDAREAALDAREAELNAFAQKLNAEKNSLDSVMSKLEPDIQQEISNISGAGTLDTSTTGEGSDSDGEAGGSRNNNDGEKPNDDKDKNEQSSNNAPEPTSTKKC